MIEIFVTYYRYDIFFNYEIIILNIKKLPGGGIGLHCVKAFPVKSSMQAQTEMCFVT